MRTFAIMNLKELRQKRWFRIISNKYVLLLLVFGVWMLFLDSNSWLVQHELNQEIEELKHNKTYYQTEIKKDEATIESLNHAEGLEKFARENYFMKRKNEDIYLIKYEDSLKNK